ncbi:MAG TPA: HDOD domain-containing protein [Polyangiaceae bacterium]|nr:HDOD domain-containing protein [Polyangiaceae bacterium]
MASRIQVRGIDEELWFGDYSDAEAEKKAAESVAATVGRVVGAKPFPVAAQKLAEATRDPDCSLIQVVRILERDMALSARVLRLVNSASFALRTPCTSVRHAASLVGTQKLNQLATTAAILDMVDHTSVHASRILEHSAVVGGLCRYLGVHLGLPADELFTCGFLHDIGKLMLLEVEGKKYGELLTEVGAEYDAIHLYERELFGFDHALLAGHVLSRWSIPDPVPKVVAWHHHVTRAYEQGPRWASLCSVLRLADLLSYALTSEDDEAQVERAARSESASYLDISAAQLAAIWDELRNLHERSRALFRGEEPPVAMPEVSLRPAPRPARPSVSKRLSASHPSLRPPTLKGLGDLTSSSRRGFVVAAPAQIAIKDAPEGPKQFPCVVCSGPSFANVCPACHGYVCPAHQAGPDEWCKLCRTEYLTESYGIRLRPILVLMLGAGVGATSVGACVSMATGRGFGTPAMLVGPLIGTALAAGLVAIFHRYARRAWFVRTRPDRSAAGAAHVSTPLPPDPAKEGESAPDSGVRDSSRPAPQVAPTTAMDADEPVKAAPDVFAAREAHVSLRALALTSASVTPADGGSGSRGSSHAPGRRGRGASSTRASSASTAPTQLQSAWPRARSHPAAATSAVPPTLAVPEAELPRVSKKPAPVAPTASELPLETHENGSVFPGEESSREAEERGRTLKLLSDHAAGGAGPVSARTSAAAPVSVRGSAAAPASARGGSLSVVSRPPSVEPAISVRPIVDASMRPLEFPDYSNPPPATAARTSLAAEPHVAPSSPSAMVAPNDAAASVVTPAAAPRSAPPAPERASDVSMPGQPAWQAVLQSTGTADGW